MRNRHTIYRQLLRLYPKQYRDKYSEQMLQTLDDMVEDQPSTASKNLVKAKAYVELPFSVAQQNLAVATTTFTNDTPNYAKQTSLIGAILMIPFFLVVFTDATENPALTDRRVWGIVFTITLLVLPAIAFVINGVSYLVWLRDRSDKKASLINKLLDWKRSWPMLAVGGAGLLLCLMILFHDSASCITNNFPHAMRSPGQTWQCIDKGMLGGNS